MNVYRVRHRCIFEAPKGLRRKGESRKKIGNPVQYVDCLVKARDIDHAEQLGNEFAQGHATSEWRLIAVEHMETARVQFPMALGE